MIDEQTQEQKDAAMIARWRSLAFYDLSQTIRAEEFLERRRQEDEIIHLAASAMSREIDRLTAERDALKQTIKRLTDDRNELREAFQFGGMANDKASAIRKLLEEDGAK